MNAVATAPIVDDEPGPIVEARPTLTERQRALLVGLAVAVLCLAALNGGGHTYSIDNEVQLQTTRSLVQLQPELESVDSIWADRTDGPYVKRDDGTYVGVYGIGYSIMSAPVYAVSRAAAQFIDEPQRDTFIRTGTMFTNAIVLAAIVVLLVLIGLEVGGGFGPSVVVALVYAFGTYALPHAKTYFTELGSALCVCAAVLLALRAARSRSMTTVFWCGFVAGFGVLVRTTASMFVVILLVWLVGMCLRERRPRDAITSAAVYCLGGIIPLLTFLFMNWWRYGSPVDLGYPNAPQNFPLREGLMNLMFTPGKSIFLYAPVVVIGLVGFVVGARRAPMPTLLIATLAGSNIFLFSRVPFWSGDAAWGPRYQQIILPLLCVPAVFVADRRWWRPAMAVCATVGFVVPAMLGSLIYFNVLNVRADIAGVPRNEIIETAAWNPLLGNLELVAPGVRDVLDANRAGELARGPYSSDPTAHYGYFSVEPRIDMWWLWVEPTSRSNASYLYLLPILGGLAYAAWVASTGRLPVVRRIRPSNGDGRARTERDGDVSR